MRWNPRKKNLPKRTAKDYSLFYQILAPLEPWIPKAQLEAWMMETIRTFHRRDRIEYILMVQRILAVLRLLEKLPRDITVPGVKKLQAYYFRYFATHPFISWYLSQNTPVFPNRASPEAEIKFQEALMKGKTELEHLYNTAKRRGFETSLNISWVHQGIEELQNQLFSANKADDEEERSEFIIQDDLAEYGGELIVRCKHPSYAWYLLRSDKQWRKEAEIMDHCATSRHGWLLSLREKVPGRGLKPHITFEYIHNLPDDVCDCHPTRGRIPFSKTCGVLGEMKGTANSKPLATYHPMIVDLLLKKNILWLHGGEYRPEADFKLKDLAEPLAQEVEEARPELYDDKLLLVKAPKRLASWLKLRLSGGKNVKMVGRKLVTQTFSDITEAYKYITEEKLFSECSSWRENVQDRFDRLASIMENPGQWEWNNPIARYEARSFLMNLDGLFLERTEKALKEVLPKLDPELTYEKMWGYLIDDEWGEVPDDIIDAIETAIHSGINEGWESGTLGAMWDQLSKIFPVETSQGVQITENAIIVSPRAAIAWALQREESLTISEEECQSVRRVLEYANNITDFDEATAKERFVDRLLEELSSIK